MKNEKNPENIIEIKNLTKNFTTPSETLKVLRGINLTIRRGEFISIMGPSGSGKSTLLNIIGLLDSFEEGDYFLSGIDINTLSFKDKRRIRLYKLGFIFQTFNLIQTLTIQQNIEFPMALAKISQSKQNEKSEILLEKFGLSNKARNFPYQLSIGEQQRVAISRALVMEPVLILLDEPTGNLDAKNSEKTLDYLQTLRRFNTSILIVSHNPTVKRITDKNYILEEGVLKPFK
ncbi:ABC transporter ATP-binding protein [Promethearchaeum syntrophicum]|uniref:ABC transporter ATP-binding protein n=1 Tax=Promethearchaeum syntrophicum TaxID=2594042 RepID=A0A5B9D5K8_9ARCH|nr:ABC transporter ATP-binding protein [Candidatus Prometheoarchaeum syntrophicum]QEE14364.1 putative ABC transporter ATP-binding protein [Candidatus Prometheoarchaeum syntrophicum]